MRNKLFFFFFFAHFMIPEFPLFNNQQYIIIYLIYNLFTRYYLIKNLGLESNIFVFSIYVNLYVCFRLSDFVSFFPSEMSSTDPC